MSLSSSSTQSTEEYLVAKKYKLFENIEKTFIISLDLSCQDVLLSVEYTTSQRIVGNILKTIPNYKTLTVLEENAGIGSLTVELSKHFKRVQIVNSSEAILGKVLSHLHITNVGKISEIFTPRNPQEIVYIFENNLSDERGNIQNIRKYAFSVNLGFEIKDPINSHEYIIIDFMQIFRRVNFAIPSVPSTPPSNYIGRVYSVASSSDRTIISMRVMEYLKTQKINKSKRDITNALSTSSTDSGLLQKLGVSMYSHPQLSQRISSEIRKFIFNSVKNLNVLQYSVVDDTPSLSASNTHITNITDEMLNQDEDLGNIPDKSINLAVVHCGISSRPRGYILHRAIVSKLAEGGILVFSDYTLSSILDTNILKGLGVKVDENFTNMKEWRETLLNKFRIIDTCVENPGVVTEVTTYVCKKISWGD